MIYHIILDVAVFVSILSVAAGLLQGQPTYAILSTALILLYLIVLQYVTMRHQELMEKLRCLSVMDALPGALQPPGTVPPIGNHVWRRAQRTRRNTGSGGALYRHV